jgi:hypothetical protein
MDVIMHLLIPLLLAKMFKPSISNKYLLGLLPFAVFFDLDGFLGMKKLFHSVLVVVLVIALIYFLVRKSRDWQTIIGLSGFYMASHMLLDFGRPMAPLFPLTQEAYYVEMNVAVQGFMPLFNFGVHKLAPCITCLGLDLGNPISEMGFGLIFLLLVVFAWAFIWNKKKKSNFNSRKKRSY